MADINLHKILGIKNRYKIITFLENGPLTAGELVEKCESTKSNISQHLKVLHEHNLVEREKKGRSVYYSRTEWLNEELSSQAADISNVNETVMSEVFIQLVNALYSLQEKMEEQHPDVMSYYGAFNQAMHVYMRKAKQNKLPHPKTKGEYLEFLARNIQAFRIPILLDWTVGEGYPVIDKDTGKMHSFWVSFLEEGMERDSEESENFIHIRRLISRSEDQDELLFEFTKLRQFISNPQEPAFFTLFERKKLLSPFPAFKYPDIYKRVNDFFERVDATKFYTCPHCGRVLNATKRENVVCIHWRCNELIRQTRESKPLETVEVSNRQIFTLTDWVIRYMRIPGIEEERIGEKCRDILNEKPQMDVIMNPDGDRVDIQIESHGQPLIQGDVKDYKHPYNLAKHLNEYDEHKCGELDKVYIIIPRDTAKRTAHSYVDTVKRLLRPEQDFLEIVTEDKWYKELRRIGGIGL